LDEPFASYGGEGLSIFHPFFSSPSSEFISSLAKGRSSHPISPSQGEMSNEGGQWGSDKAGQWGSGKRETMGFRRRRTMGF